MAYKLQGPTETRRTMAGSFGNIQQQDSALPKFKAQERRGSVEGTVHAVWLGGQHWMSYRMRARDGVDEGSEDRVTGEEDSRRS